jgi:predicted metal-binding membrane protein
MTSGAGTIVAARGSDRRERLALREVMRLRVGVVLILLLTAGVAWWSSAAQMSGMDAGPGTELGTLVWFTGAWTVMMAAMMLPSVAPTAAAFAAPANRREPSRWLLFAGGYLLVWSVAGVVAYGLFELGRRLFAGGLAWGDGGQWLSAATLVLAAGYQLTPLKRACLAHCRSSWQVLSDEWREGRSHALAMGVRSAGWCIGSSWALMTVLFALGVMNLTWMVLVSILVAAEKLSPAPRSARTATAVLLAVLAVGVLAAPRDVPGLVVPGSPGAMHAMKTMD